jgi:hypothetical protein
MTQTAMDRAKLAELAHALDNRWMRNCHQIGSGVLALSAWSPSPIGEIYEAGWAFNRESWRGDDRSKPLLEAWELLDKIDPGFLKARVVQLNVEVMFRTSWLQKSEPTRVCLSRQTMLSI